MLSSKIPKKSISRVQLLFPDPWPKKRHLKRRIIQLDFVNSIYDLLSADGVFHVATDCEDYAVHIKDVMTGITKFNDCSNGDSRGLHFTREITKFEKKGLEKGHQIWDFSYIS